jgi:hypothetical protein
MGPYDRESLKEKNVLKQYYSYLPVGETEFAPIAANVTRFCMFTEFTTEKHK